MLTCLHKELLKKNKNNKEQWKTESKTQQIKKPFIKQYEGLQFFVYHNKNFKPTYLKKKTILLVLFCFSEFSDSLLLLLLFFLKNCSRSRNVTKPNFIFTLTRKPYRVYIIKG